MKPLELWVFKDQLRKMNYTEVSQENVYDSEVIHVIEYSAYEQLQRQWKAAIDSAHDIAVESEVLRKERDDAISEAQMYRQCLESSYSYQEYKQLKIDCYREYQQIKKERDDYREALENHDTSDHTFYFVSCKLCKALAKYPKENK